MIFIACLLSYYHIGEFLLTWHS